MATQAQIQRAQNRFDPSIPLTLVNIKRDDVIIHRFTNGNQKTVSNGHPYTPFPFALKRPEKSAAKIPTIKLQFANVTQRLQRNLLEAAEDNSTWTFDVLFVYSTEPDSPFEAYEDFQIQGEALFNQKDISFSISPWNLQNRAMVVYEFDTFNTPAVNR